MDVRYILTDAGMRYDVYSPARKISAHILLPEDRKCAKLLVNGEVTPFETETVGQSVYVNTAVSGALSPTRFEVLFI